jgi:hypothetical protein
MYRYIADLDDAGGRLDLWWLPRSASLASGRGRVPDMRAHVLLAYSFSDICTYAASPQLVLFVI